MSLVLQERGNQQRPFVGPPLAWEAVAFFPWGQWSVVLGIHRGWGGRGEWDRDSVWFV